MERRAIVVRGIVQGVGFRPFVYNLACDLKLGGYVKNRAGEVFIEVEGEAPALEHFVIELSKRAPRLAQIEQLRWENRPPQGEHKFRIEASDNEAGHAVFISPDVAVCPDCLRELFDPADRRYRYPFLNCTNCGPRLTIIQGAPYDRSRTTMAAFPMCARCRSEYDNPTDRRFHAQPTACPACGPELQALDAKGQRVPGDAMIEEFAAAIGAGEIVALKGLGGYHLVCDARNAATVAELRRRKHRDEKPFAVMMPDIAGVGIICELSAFERDLLLSPQAPIVLLRKRLPSPLAEQVAPGNPWLGVMLPYTPLHRLLMAAVGGTPLVMTSGNRSDEPIAYRDDDAITRLKGIAHRFLAHNRPIYVRCDDSVTGVVEGRESPIRRSRGYAPRPIELPFACPRPILALGGQLKATFALGRGTQAFVSHHLGDLDHLEAFRAYVKDVELYQNLFAVRPEILAHDLHPDYASTRYALEQASGKQLLSVQHHHAHLASCMAEHKLTEPVIGVILDGTGYGTDGTVWGGEFLVGGYEGFRRAAHLRYVGMPGGEQAIREPWRMAVAYLMDARAELPALAARISLLAFGTIRRMLEKGVNTPLTSSAGRLFDAVAALAGVRDRVTFEGQAAIELEWRAMSVDADGVYPFEICQAQNPAAPLVIDTCPLIAAIAEEVKKGTRSEVIARRFHTTVAELILATCGRIRGLDGCGAAVLSGGVFQNALLSVETSSRLRAAGFRVYQHTLVPPNDGGLSLGQLAIAAASGG